MNGIFYFIFQATCSKDGTVRIYEAPDIMNLSQWQLQVCFPYNIFLALFVFVFFISCLLHFIENNTSVVQFQLMQGAIYTFSILE